MRRTAALLGGSLSAALFSFPAVALAHERWFVDPATVGETPAFFRTFGLHAAVAAIGIVLALVVAKLLDRWLRAMQFGTGLSSTLARLAPWVPLPIAWATAALLVSVALNRALLAPHLVLPDTPSGTALVIAQLLTAAALALGLFTRLGAGALIVFAVWSFALFGLPAVENLMYLGVGFFLFVWGRGRLSLGAVFSRVVFAMDTAHMKPVALSVLRIVTGAALAWGAADKLIHPEFHLQLIADHASWNPLWLIRASVWPSLSEELYLFCAAAVEMGAALLLISGWLLRPVAGGLFLLFILSTIFLPGGELVRDLVGHLPYMGAMLAFLVLGKTVERSDRLL